jgi:hypothetical protein
MFGVTIYGAHDDRSAANGVSACHGAPQRVAQKSAANAFPGKRLIDCELAQQDRGDRIRMPPGPDGPRHPIRRDCGRRQTIISNDRIPSAMTMTLEKPFV